MSMNDPGFEAFGEGAPDAPPTPPSERTAPAAPPAGGDAWSTPTPGYQPTPPPAPSGPSGSGGGGRTKVLIGVAVAVVVVLVIVIIAVAAGGGKHKTATTTTTTGGQTSTTVGGSTATTAGGSSGGGAKPAIMTVLPSGLGGHCETVAGSDRTFPSASEEVGCITTQVQGAGADVIGYDRYPAAGGVTSTFSSVLSDNKVSANQGDCEKLSLAGDAPTGSYCESNWTDSDGNSGTEMIFVGTDFQLGTTKSVAAVCSEAGGQAGAGATVMVWTTPDDDLLSYAADCSTNGQYASTLQQNLQADNYGLTD